MHGPLSDLAIVALRALPLASPLAALLASLRASATTANPLLWYVTRAAAVSAYITLSCTAALGIWRSLGRVTRRRVSWLLDEAHQYLALLTAAFILLHLLALVFDPLIPFAPLNLLVPLGEPYRPFAVDLGVLTLYALVIVLVSSWLRRSLSFASWRALHYVSFVAFVLVTLHGLLAGSDAGQPWMRLVYIGASLAVGLLVIMRLMTPTPHPAGPRLPAARRGAASARPPTQTPV
ncbi:MAG TPA: ferric reductase-like transmembrane domain-containing protein [Ktedonobacterales bacterium]